MIEYSTKLICDLCEKDCGDRIYEVMVNIHWKKYLPNGKPETGIRRMICNECLKKNMDMYDDRTP